MKDTHLAKKGLLLSENVDGTGGRYIFILLVMYLPMRLYTLQLTQPLGTFPHKSSARLFSRNT